jgi:hypothetical protein
MNNHSPDLETLLRSAPRPEPPPQLLAALEAQLDASFAPAPAAAPARPRRSFWRRAWLPLTGLVGTAAAVILGVVLLGTGTTRALAQSLEALTKVKSFRVVERVRSGPGKPVIHDPAKPPQNSPNYLTGLHPGNPFVEIQHWFRADTSAPGQGLIYTASERSRKWQAGNIILEINEKTGQREVQLNSSHTMFGGIANPIVMGAQGRKGFVELNPAKVPDLPAKLAATVGVFEFRYSFEMSGVREENIERVWIERATQRPLRVQFWGTVWPDIAPEVLLQEYIFSDFDADLPDSIFAFTPTDADLAPFGLTAAELAPLPKNAFSVGLTGEAGAEITGTVKDKNGTREIHGRLPFGFVHVPAGDVSYDFRMVDGKKRSFGAAINGTRMSTITSRIRGEVTAKGTSIQGG